MPVDVSTQQMALTRDLAPGGFMERVQAMLAFVARDVLNEAASTPYHQGRALYAQSVVRASLAAATNGGPLIVMGVNVIAKTTYDEATKTATCAIADIDLQSQIQTLWNPLGGLDTPSDGPAATAATTVR